METKVLTINSHQFDKQDQIRVLLIDDQEIIAQGIKEMLATEKDIFLIIVRSRRKRFKKRLICQQR